MSNEYLREWYKNNKDKHLEYCREKIACECGKSIARNSMSNHRKSKKHMKFVEDQKANQIDLKTIQYQTNKYIAALEESGQITDSCKILFIFDATKPS